MLSIISYQTATTAASAASPQAGPDLPQQSSGDPQAVTLICTRAGAPSALGKAPIPTGAGARTAPGTVTILTGAGARGGRRPPGAAAPPPSPPPKIEPPARRRYAIP